MASCSRRLRPRCHTRTLGWRWGFRGGPRGDHDAGYGRDARHDVSHHVEPSAGARVHRQPTGTTVRLGHIWVRVFAFRSASRCNRGGAGPPRWRANKRPTRSGRVRWGRVRYVGVTGGLQEAGGGGQCAVRGGRVAGGGGTQGAEGSALEGATSICAPCVILCACLLSCSERVSRCRRAPRPARAPPGTASV